MAEGKIMGVQIFRAIQIVLAVLGIVFSVTSSYIYWALVVLYCVALIYLLMLAICTLAGRSQLQNPIQAIVESVIGVTLIIYTIVLITYQGKDVWLILAIIIGFILPALLFITAYDKT